MGDIFSLCKCGSAPLWGTIYDLLYVQLNDVPVNSGGGFPVPWNDLYRSLHAGHYAVTEAGDRRIFGNTEDEDPAGDGPLQIGTRDSVGGGYSWDDAAPFSYPLDAFIKSAFDEAHGWPDENGRVLAGLAGMKDADGEHVWVLVQTTGQVGINADPAKPAKSWLLRVGPSAIDWSLDLATEPTSNYDEMFPTVGITTADSFLTPLQLRGNKTQLVRAIRGGTGEGAIGSTLNGYEIYEDGQVRRVYRPAEGAGTIGFVKYDGQEIVLPAESGWSTENRETVGSVVNPYATAPYPIFDTSYRPRQAGDQKPTPLIEFSSYRLRNLVRSTPHLVDTVGALSDYWPRCFLQVDSLTTKELTGHRFRTGLFSAAFEEQYYYEWSREYGFGSMGEDGVGVIDRPVFSTPHSRLLSGNSTFTTTSGAAGLIVFNLTQNDAVDAIFCATNSQTSVDRTVTSPGVEHVFEDPQGFGPDVGTGLFTPPTEQFTVNTTGQVGRLQVNDTVREVGFVAGGGLAPTFDWFNGESRQLRQMDPQPASGDTPAWNRLSASAETSSLRGDEITFEYSGNVTWQEMHFFTGPTSSEFADVTHVMELPWQMFDDTQIGVNKTLDGYDLCFMSGANDVVAVVRTHIELAGFGQMLRVVHTSDRCAYLSGGGGSGLIGWRVMRDGKGGHPWNFDEHGYDTAEDQFPRPLPWGVNVVPRTYSSEDGANYVTRADSVQPTGAYIHNGTLDDLLVKIGWDTPGPLA